MKKINKKYAEVMRQADNAVGRKEVVSLLKSCNYYVRIRGKLGCLN